MNTEDILIWIITNLLTDSQLDARMPTGKTVREWHSRRQKERGR